MRFPPETFTLAEQQLGLLTRDQLIAAGSGASTVSRLVERGHLVPVARGVFRIGGAPSNWRQSVLAHCLAAGPLTVASHRTAARLHRLDVAGGKRIELLAPRWHRTHPRAGVRVHEARDLRADDVTSIDGIPTTDQVRTILDLASCLPPHHLARVVDATVRDDPATAARLELRYRETRRQGKRGYTALRLILEEVAGRPLRTDSRFEDRTVAIIERLGLPLPVAQHPVDLGGVTCFLDLAWPELQLLIECDSLAHHRDVEAFRWDRRRQNLLVLAGWQVLRFSWDDVTSRSTATGRVILQAYRSRQRRRLDHTG